MATKKKNVSVRELSLVTSYTDREDFHAYLKFIKSPWKTFGFSFLRGTGYGLGIILGASIVLAFLNYSAQVLYDVPGIGEVIKNGVEKIEQQPGVQVK